MSHRHPRAIGETSQERDHRIHRIFTSLKPNEQGYVFSDNIHQHLDQFTHHPFGKRYAEELAQYCDTNQDHRIDYKEFYSFMTRKERELMRMFDAVDASQEGVITVHELNEALRTAGKIYPIALMTCVGIYIPEAETKHLMDIIDKDKSGTIDFQEWRDFLLVGHDLHAGHVE